MTVSDQLHKLIHALTRNEKRYFKIYAKNGSEGDYDYIALFDAIEKQKKYDEDKLLQTLGKAKWSKNLSATKNRLYELLLRSLTEFHFDKSIDSKINNLISYTRLLQNKGLYKPAVKYLNKAAELAQKHEKFTRSLEIMEIEKLLTIDMRMGKIAQGLQHITELEKETVNRLLNKSAYMEAYFEAQKVYKNEKYLRSPEKVAAFEKILSNKLFKKEEEALSIYSKNIYYELHSLHFWNISEGFQAYTIKKKQIELWHSQPELLDEDAQTYITLLSDFLYISYHAGQIHELTENIEKLRAIETNDQELRRKIFVESSIFTLIFYQQQGDYDTCLHTLATIKKELPNYEDLMNMEDKTRMFISSSIIAFGGEDFSQSLFWINKILNMKEFEMREDIHCFARIFNLFIHFELDDGRLLEYIIQSTYRFLTKRKKLFKLEKAVIRFLKKLINADDQEDMQVLFKSLREEFLIISEDPYEKKFFKVFDFITWLEAKIEGRKYKDLIKERAVKKN
jgi:hypothetical protein